MTEDLTRYPACSVSVPGGAKLGHAHLLVGAVAPPSGSRETNYRHT